MKEKFSFKDGMDPAAIGQVQNTVQTESGSKGPITKRPLTIREYIGILLPDGGEGFREGMTGSREPIDIQIVKAAKKLWNRVSRNAPSKTQ